MRRAVPAVVLAVLVVLAGCASIPGLPGSGGTTDANPGRGTTDAGPGDGTTDADPGRGTTDGETGDGTTGGGTDGDRTRTGDGTRNGAGTPTGDRTSDGDPPRVTVVDGTLPVDAGVVYGRVAALLDADAPPTRVHVGFPAGYSDRRASVQDPESFLAVMGVEWTLPTADVEAVTVRAATTREGTVYLVPAADSPPGEVERTLAHELVHVVQYRTGAIERLRATGPPDHRTTVDGRLANRAVVEGVAAYVAGAYVRRFLDGVGVRTERELLADAYPNATTATRFFWAPYRYGVEHVAGRLDSPADHRSLYADPPTTGEQVLHGRSAGPPRDLSVALATGPGWERVDGDTYGELYLRVLLSDRLSGERSARAAAGWGNDERIEVRAPDGGVGYAWAIRADDPRNATELRRALAAFLDRRADRAGERAGRDRWTGERYAFAVERVGEETVVLLAGDRAFLAAASVGGTDGEVTVEVSGAGRIRAGGDARPAGPAPSPV